MAITVTCPSCATRAQVPDGAVEAKGKCRICGGTVRSPGDAKVCCVCGVDVSHQKRTKDQHGNYYCEPCWSGTVHVGETKRASVYTCADCGGSFGAGQVFHEGGKHLCMECYPSRAFASGPDDSTAAAPEEDILALAAAEADYELAAHSHRALAPASKDRFTLLRCNLCNGMFTGASVRNAGGRTVCTECDDNQVRRRSADTVRRRDVELVSKGVLWMFVTLLAGCGVTFLTLVIAQEQNLSENNQADAHREVVRVPEHAPRPDRTLATDDDEDDESVTTDAPGTDSAQAQAGEEQEAAAAHQRQAVADQLAENEVWRVAEKKLNAYYSSAYVRLLRDLGSLEEAAKASPKETEAEWVLRYMTAYIAVLKAEKDRLVQMPTLTDAEQATLAEAWIDVGACDGALATRIKCSADFHRLAIALLTDAVNGRWAGEERRAKSLLAELQAGAATYRGEAVSQHGLSLSRLKKSGVRGWKAEMMAEGLSVDGPAIAAAAAATMENVQAEGRDILAAAESSRVAGEHGQASDGGDAVALEVECEACDGTGRLSPQQLRAIAARYIGTGRSGTIDARCQRCGGSGRVLR